ncbi:MAG: aminoacyl--tRNA ligase-related protein [Patescibacteria group bacterium]|jgi:prolyl-tRNA synthetase
MRYSQSFIKTNKEAPKEAETISHRLLLRGGFIHPLGAGFYSLLPLGFKVYLKIYNIIMDELHKIGVEDMVMPVVHPARVWKETGRFSEVGPELWKIKNRSDEDFVLAMTHEEVVTDAAKAIISSYKDLPKLVGQIQTKVRDEARARGGLIRTKEFTMQDAYSFDRDEAGLDAVYQKFIGAYNNIFQRVGVETVMIESSTGAMGGSGAHEFMMITPSGEDKIVICKDCGCAVNAEVLGIMKEGADEPNVSCKKCGSTNCEFKRGIESGNIFKLGTKYSIPMKLIYTDENNQQKPVVMGSYGIGLERLMASVIEASNDSRGMIWPENIAPFKLHLISIDKNKKADAIYEKLVGKGIEVFYDDRDVSPGEKFADADLIGIPYRATVSRKTAGKIELKRRTESEVKLVTTAELLKLLK